MCLLLLSWLLREINDLFPLFLGIAHSLVSPARIVFHTKNHQIAPIHHLPVADLIGPLGVTVLRGITDLDFVVIG